MGRRQGGGRSWLHISPEFWKMPFLPSGLLAVTEITIVTNRAWKGKETGGAGALAGEMGPADSKKGRHPEGKQDS